MLTSAKSAIGKQTSVHLVVTSRSSSSSVEERLEADLAKTSGKETISVGSEAAMIKLTPTYAYLSGNSSGLTKIVGLTSAQVKKLGRASVSTHTRSPCSATHWDAPLAAFPSRAPETATASGGSNETVALSKWGEHVRVSVPPAGSTIPFSSLSG